MIKNNIYAIISGFIAITMFSGCALNNDWEEKEKEEITRLEQHIARLRSQGAIIDDKEIGTYTWYYQDLGYFTTPGISPVRDNYIIIDYVEKNLIGDILYTNVDSLASKWSLYNENKDYYSYYLFVPKKIIFGYGPPGYTAGVTLMKEGQKARFYIPSGLAWVDHVSIIDEVKLYKVITDIADYDSMQVDWFLTEYEFDELTYIIDAGIYYKEIVPGDTSIDIAANDSLKVKMVAYYLQENSLIKFDSIWGTVVSDVVVIPSTKSKVESFVPKGLAPLTKGFAAAMDTVAIGTEAVILVPYNKGYANSGLVHALLGYPVVPPYSSLVYKLKVMGKIP